MPIRKDDDPDLVGLILRRRAGESVTLPTDGALTANELLRARVRRGAERPPAYNGPERRQWKRP